ncbi:cell division protein with ATPase domain, involved in recruitment of FtsK to Z ring [Magnetospira sp. QH-2]|nr:cell division protein with ATPase domain, involved in recruitment of FtsK to Z ring [Magnetospira sp. QH-2]
MSQKTAKTKTRNGLIAALDVGTTKVACLIAKAGLDDQGRPQVVGIGHQLSRGVKAGTIIDMDAAENAIRATVAAAEKMAGENIDSVVASLGGASLHSRLAAHEVTVTGHEIDDNDLRRIIDPARLQGDTPSDQQLIHALPVGYSIDGSKGIRDPRGMYGQKLGVNLHLVRAGTGPLRNLVTCVAGSHLDVGATVVGPYAAGLSTLVDDERELGSTVVDMGGGTTDISVFFDGEMVFTASLPVGGNHVTSDIARGLSTSLVEAERAKVLYGCAIASPADEQDYLVVPLIGEEEDGGDAQQVSRAELNAIIRPRLEEIFELVRGTLETAGFDRVGGRRLVLTGGSAQLPGLRDLAALILDKQVRIGRPTRIKGLADAVSGPAFAVSAGLLHHAFTKDNLAEILSLRPLSEPTSTLGRVGRWLRENF